MRQEFLALGLLLSGLVAGSARADADEPAAKSAEVVFLGYQMLNGQVSIQLHVLNLPAADQPALLKTGYRLDLGSFGTYTVGAFHQQNTNAVDPATGKFVPVDTSTVELIDAAGHKTVLPFRRATEVKPSSGAMT